jgi:3',5'-cyclic AMP phosphodiesterase CpdA
MHTFGQHPAPEMTLMHLSDTHLLAGDEKLFTVLETEKKLEALFERTVSSGVDLTAVVITGDLTDLGEPEAYRKLANMVNPWAQSLGAEVVWVMGNHDERGPYSDILMGTGPSNDPQDAVYEWDGLRLIVLDTSVPGYHHGELTSDQITWLGNQLATPAPRGTLLAMHHPPIPTPVTLMGLIELERQDEFWNTVAGTDVRGILAGHLHYATFSTRHAIPLSIAPGMCYNIDLLGAKDRVLVAADRGQAVSLVSVYPDQVVFSHLSANDMPEIHGFSAEAIEQIAGMTLEQQRQMFSLKSSGFNLTQDR